MFGNKSLPTKVYKYGVKETNNNDAIIDQIKKAHDYRNKLVEIERNRRDKFKEAVKQLFPQLIDMEAAIKQLENKFEEIQTKINQIKKETKSKIIKDNSLLNERECVKKELKLKRDLFRKENKSCYENEKVKEKSKSIDKEFKEKTKNAYKEFTKLGLYHGTANLIPETVKRSGKPPRFKKWNGGYGRVSVQTQKKDKSTGRRGGVSVNEAYVENTLFYIKIVKEFKKHKYAIAYMRIGSDKRKPVWLEIKFKMHRPMPENAKIQRVNLQREKIGSHNKLTLQIILSKNKWDKQETNDNVIGLDLGWRQLQDNSVRAAYYSGLGGDNNQIVIPSRIYDRNRKINDLQSIRDNNFNSTIKLLKLWMNGKELPEWFVEDTKTIDKWESQNRLAFLVIKWRNNRFVGDEIIFLELEKWRRQDKHLWDWKSHQTKSIINWREDFYRKWAFKLRKKYSIFCVEDTDWAKLAKSSKEKDVSVKNRNLASVGKLLTIIEQYADRIIKVPSPNTSKKCNVCGKICKLNHKVVDEVCEHCGAEWDRDHNGSLNILQSGIDVIAREKEQGKVA